MNKLNNLKNSSDEYYTSLSDIEDELSRYFPFFKGKIVYCNCDKPSESNFYKFFKENFRLLKLKRLVATYYNPDSNPYVTIYNGNVTERYQLKGDGSFDSPECIKFLMTSDIVVTNPPFSKFSKFLTLLMASKKKFLIIGSNTSSVYNKVFPLLKSGQIKMGYNNGKHSYKTPFGSRKVSTIWYTNFPIKKDIKELTLMDAYAENNYTKYDNYHAINVDSVSKIPKDFYGVVGVPITYLEKHNPKQFEIIGVLRNPSVKGKNKFTRVLIRRI